MQARPDSSMTPLSPDKPLSIAILAMGGQGGGVLADWIVALAETQGWSAQTTSVPGVAQRTGATIYYLELLRAREGSTPVLCLMPTPGDVDVVIAAELMEAGRSILRGLVTPEKTILLASTHRAYAVGEKEKPGDGTGDPTVVEEATAFAAKKTIAFDMDAIAVENDSVISSALFGALAAAKALPFAKSAFIATIQATGKGIEASLKTFEAAYRRTLKDANDKLFAAPSKRLAPPPDKAGHPALDKLLARLRAEFPPQAHAMLYAGLRKLTEFQDPAYAEEYLTRCAALTEADRKNGGEAKAFSFTVQAAKYLAVAMAYDDVIRVAEVKISGVRFARVRKEIGVKADQIAYTTEYMHPRMEEVCGILPKRLGEWIENTPKFFAWLDRRVNKGRRINSGSLLWFTGLYLLSGIRRYRRGSLRHHREAARREAWLTRALDVLPKNYDLAVEVLGCHRLIKGYSDTYARGLSKFDRVLSALPLLETRNDGGAWLGRLRQAALLDEGGIALDGALKTVASL